MFEYRLKFHWRLFLRVKLTIFRHWFRKWLGAVQATSHYLNQWRLVCWRIFASLSLNELFQHDDVIKWKHFPRYWPFVRGIHRSPVNSPHKGQWRGALMFSLICVWINGWVNNGEAGDLRRHRGHYDVNVMKSYIHIDWRKDYETTPTEINLSPFRMLVHFDMKLTSEWGKNGGEIFISQLWSFSCWFRNEQTFNEWIALKRFPSEGGFIIISARVYLGIEGRLWVEMILWFNSLTPGICD